MNRTELRKLLNKNKALARKNDRAIEKLTAQNNTMSNVIHNIDKVSKIEIEVVINDTIHSVPYTDSDLPMKALARIMNDQRPFIDRFKMYFDIDDVAKDIPSIFSLTATYATIKKDIEDYLFGYWLDAMRSNKLELHSLTPNYARRIKEPFINNYVPLLRSGKLIQNISWRVVDAS